MSPQAAACSSNRSVCIAHEDSKLMAAGHVVGVYGATGRTGGFVVAELERRGLQPMAIGRDAARLRDLGARNQDIETRVADPHTPLSLNDAFAGASLVINCAGPFLDTAGPIAEAALRAGIHYLDVTAEQASASLTLQHFDSPARAKGVVVAPAVGFFGGLGDLLASAAIRGWREADEIQIAIALDSWHPTRGTVLTGQRNTSQRLVVTHGELQPIEIPPARSTWTFPEPFGFQQLTEVPLSETILIHRHLQVTEVHNFLNEAPLRDLNDPATPPPQSSDEWGRSAQQFVMEASVRRGGETRRALAKGRDIYAVTAPLVVEAARRILDGAVEGGGSFAVGQMFDAASFLQTLEPEHMSVDLPGVIRAQI
jgi:hypothetical protein